VRTPTTEPVTLTPDCTKLTFIGLFTATALDVGEAEV